ncbi:MAG: AI-2E family transporter [Brevundimonas sp.]|uniref:AI-2E family transporter n=1 Tax=Brevundimonas sp. TaxID=1871086 RepID=UPI00271867E5|nr:AI-2E family transporter [Brevundimonas sp.]MDO9587850.1 AI-2E family transporter [Brevundimonas sp.]MDP3369360.1 AI-2E family transporter [Brevundimonas sp.]MDP3658127.1 AI-2E family transporter [Brevundimonas sp.]MDZ4109425.1 AI-2E family transporter [Brevundimonas sp.]
MKPALTVPTSAVSRNALVLIAVVAAGAAVFWLRDILTPLAMAIFLLIMIDGLKRWIERHALAPGRWAGAVALIVVILGFLASIAIIVHGARGFFTQASDDAVMLGPRLDQILADVYRLFDLSGAPTASELLGRIDVSRYFTTVAMQAQGAVTGALFVMIYLGFLMASQNGFRRKLVGMFPERHARTEAMEVFQRVRGGVEGYLWVQAVTGVLICAVAWVLMRAVGLQNAEFWTFVIFVVGFIPVLGGAVAGLAPPLAALVQFESYWPALILLVGLQAILFISGNFIQPRMQGDNQNIDPVVVLLSLALWGHLWGVVGMFLSTPLAVMAMAVLAEFKGSRWMAILLSGDGEPYADEGHGPAPRPKRTRVNPPQSKAG